MAGSTISYAETIAIQAFLGYLTKNWSKSINAKDTFLIAAVSAWFHQESGGLSRVIGNNPFNIRNSPLQSGTRKTLNGNGHFAVFSSMARGFMAAAYLLMHGSKAYGYQLALNAMKKGGNQGAVDFLAALAMSSWDAGHYGAHSWIEAYDQAHNHLLRNYVGIAHVQLANPHPKPPKPTPVLPRDFNYRVVIRNYIDPWAVQAMYRYRRGRTALGNRVDGSGTKR